MNNKRDYEAKFSPKLSIILTIGFLGYAWGIGLLPNKFDRVPNTDHTAKLPQYNSKGILNGDYDFPPIAFEHAIIPLIILTILMIFGNIYTYKFQNGKTNPNGILHRFYNGKIINYRGYNVTTIELFILCLYITLLATRWHFYGTLQYMSFLTTARTIGYILQPIASVQILLALQNNFVQIFGISKERALKYHRINGFVMYILLAWKTWLMVDWWSSEKGKYYRFDLKWDVTFYDPTDRLHPSMGIVGFGILSVLVFFALPPIRRRFYDLFMYTHMLWSPAMICFTLHQSYNQVWFIPALCLWFIDFTWRDLTKSKKEYKIINATAIPGKNGSITRLEIQPFDGFKYEAGQYCWIIIPQISHLINHPFSLSSSPTNEENITFHIKNMGQGTFTDKLYQLVESNSLKNIHIGPPCGKLMINIDSYDCIVMCAGGIGITPMISIFLDMWKKSKSKTLVKLIWCVRDTEAVQWFKAKLKDINAKELADKNYHFIIHNTKSKQVEHIVFNDDDEKKEENEENTGLLVEAGRPNYKKIFESIKTDHPNSNGTAVLCCGPARMVESIESTAFKLSTSAYHFDVHKETFHF